VAKPSRSRLREARLQGLEHPREPQGAKRRAKRGPRCRLPSSLLVSGEGIRAVQEGGDIEAGEHGWTASFSVPATKMPFTVL